MTRGLLVFLMIGSGALTAGTAAAQPEATVPPRIRFGVDAGMYGGAASTGLAFGGALRVRVGAQLTPVWAVYYQAGGLIGAAAGLYAPTYDFYLHTSSALVELSLGRLVQIALGPSGIVGTFGQGLAAGVGGSVRIALNWGPRSPTERQGFTFGFAADAFGIVNGSPFGNIGVIMGYDLF